MCRRHEAHQPAPCDGGKIFPISEACRSSSVHLGVRPIAWPNQALARLSRYPSPSASTSPPTRWLALDHRCQPARWGRCDGADRGRPARLLGAGRPTSRTPTRSGDSRKRGFRVRAHASQYLRRRRHGLRRRRRQGVFGAPSYIVDGRHSGAGSARLPRACSGTLATTPATQRRRGAGSVEDADLEE